MFVHKFLLLFCFVCQNWAADTDTIVAEDHDVLLLVDRPYRAEHLARSLEFLELFGRDFYHKVVLPGYFYKRVISHVTVPDLYKLKRDQLYLAAAALNGDLKTVKKYLPAILEARNNTGLNYHLYGRVCSPLDMAVYRGDDNTELIKYLLDNGADINFKNRYGDDAIMFATIMRHREVVKFLLQHGADANSKNGDNVCVAMAAAYLGNEEILGTLLQYGASVEPLIKDPDFVTILVEKPRTSCEKAQKVWDLIGQYANGWRATPEQMERWRERCAA